jgi:hypothetical protein
MKHITLTPEEVKQIINELGKMPLSQAINLYSFFQAKINEAAKAEKKPKVQDEPELKE